MRTMILIGCSKEKKACPEGHSGRVTPKDFYSGTLFTKRVECARSRGKPWWVLSAKFGLWPDYEAKYAYFEGKPYDLRLDSLGRADRAAWHLDVAKSIIETLWNGEGTPSDPRSLTVEIHAGAEYSHPLAEILRLVGVNVELPMKGLGIGEQLAWYTDLIGTQQVVKSGNRFQKCLPKVFEKLQFYAAATRPHARRAKRWNEETGDFENCWKPFVRGRWIGIQGGRDSYDTAANALAEGQRFIDECKKDLEFQLELRSRDKVSG